MGAVATAFVDRDGVINRKRPEGEYVNCREEFELLPGSVDALVNLSRAEFKVVIVTNQQGIAKGITDRALVDSLHAELMQTVSEAGGRISQVQVCPHLDGSCECRKPAVGLFERARAADPAIDFARSVVIGDSESDIEAAKRIGAKPVLVSGIGSSKPRADGVVEVADLSAAADLLTDVARV
jgi:D-glycero-D-manno-heptose 1,7-bisphosphate phosphatase